MRIWNAFSDDKRTVEGQYDARSRSGRGPKPGQTVAHPAPLAVWLVQEGRRPRRICRWNPCWQKYEYDLEKADSWPHV